jgi:8-oxo-dGTP diphosphatase
MPPSDTVQRVFGHRLRVRVCGLCFSGADLLLIRHRGLGKLGYLYAPPGGEMHYGERAEDALIREFAEETGLQVRVQEFLFVHEFLEPPLHALELFFSVEAMGGTLRRGHDPELSEQKQLIEEVRFMSPEAVAQVPSEARHAVISQGNPRDLLLRQGYF